MQSLQSPSRVLEEPQLYSALTLFIPIMSDLHSLAVAISAQVFALVGFSYVVGSILGVVRVGHGTRWLNVQRYPLCNHAILNNYLEDLHDWVKDSDVTPSHPQR